MASIEKRSENTYRIAISCGYNADGKKRRKYKTINLPEGLTERQKEKEVRKAAVLFEQEVKNNRNLNDIQKLFHQFLQMSGFDTVSIDAQHIQELMTDTQGYIETQIRRCI